MPGTTPKDRSTLLSSTLAFLTPSGWLPHVTVAWTVSLHPPSSIPPHFSGSFFSSHLSTFHIMCRFHFYSMSFPKRILAPRKQGFSVCFQGGKIPSASKISWYLIGTLLIFTVRVIFFFWENVSGTFLIILFTQLWKDRLSFGALRAKKFWDITFQSLSHLFLSFRFGLP